MKREEFHNEFGGFYDKRTENYVINPDGTYSNSLFSNETNSNDVHNFPPSITELEDEEEIIQNNDNQSNNESSKANKNRVDSPSKNLTDENQRERGDEKRTNENNNSSGNTESSQLPQKKDAGRPEKFPTERKEQNNSSKTLTPSNFGSVIGILIAISSALLIGWTLLTKEHHKWTKKNKK